MDAHDRLEQMVGDLIQIVETAKSVPMSASAVINRAEVLDILHQLRGDVAEELEESRRLTAERDEVIAQARRDAEEHIEQARRERGSMLSGTEMGREAERIRSAAIEEARRIREDADAYVDDKLANFEVVLTKTLQAVGRGRTKMAGRDPMDELGQHVAEQDAATAASRADYEYDARDHAHLDAEQEEAYTGSRGGYQRDAYDRQPDPYRELQEDYREDAYAEAAGNGYQPQDAYALPEPDFSRELTTADMSGIFQRPDFSQPAAPQPQPEYQPAYGYADNGASGYADATSAPGYADANSGYGGYDEPQHQAYPIQPYGSQYGQPQPEYQTGEYPAYDDGSQYGQPALPQQPQHPSYQQHPGQPQAQGDATGFFDTGVIDVRQFRDDPYQR